MIFFKKLKFNSNLFMAASFLAFFVLGFLYFLLSVDTVYRGMSRDMSNNLSPVQSANQFQDENCIDPSDFDMSDPYVTKAPGWKKK